MSLLIFLWQCMVNDTDRNVSGIGHVGNQPCLEFVSCVFHNPYITDIEMKLCVAIFHYEKDVFEKQECPWW